MRVLYVIIIASCTQRIAAILTYSSAYGTLVKMLNLLPAKARTKNDVQTRYLSVIFGGMVRSTVRAVVAVRAVKIPSTYGTTLSHYWLLYNWHLLRLTVKTFQCLRHKAKFFAVLQLTNIAMIEILFFKRTNEVTVPRGSGWLAKFGFMTCNPVQRVCLEKEHDRI